MISVNEAISIVKHNEKPIRETTTKPLEKAGGYILSETIYSPIDMPPFRQSAMDGYAMNLHENLSYKLIGEVKAGDQHHPVSLTGCEGESAAGRASSSRPR